MFRLRLALLVLSGLTAASTSCGPRYGEVDTETGLQGVAIRDGSLAGTWAQRTNLAALVDVPLVGQRETGGGSTRLLTRTWDAQTQRYQDSFVRCGVDVVETDGTRTIVQDETVRKIAPPRFGSSANHETGAWSTDVIVDVWGLRDLPDMIETPLPTHADYTDAPQRDWVFDEDGDDNPGVTVVMRGTISANVYVIKRNIYAFDGTVVDENRIRGVIRQTKSESNALESTVSWLEGGGKTSPHPEVLKSWFDMVRIEDGSDCADVQAVDAEGLLSKEAPF